MEQVIIRQFGVEFAVTYKLWNQATEKAVNWFCHYIQEKDQDKKQFYLYQYNRYRKTSRELAGKIKNLL